MFRIIARLLFHAALLFSGVLIIGAIDTVEAQDIAVSKDLCSPAGCISQSQSALPSVPPNTPASYSITLVNNGTSPLNVDLRESFQPGFHFTGSTCGPANPPLPAAGGSTFFGPLTLPPGTTTCVINGYFEYLPASQNNANNVVTVFASADSAHQTPLGSNAINATVSGTTPIPTDVSVSKTAAVTSTAPATGAVTVHYVITITNNGTIDVYGMQLQDTISVPSTSVPLTATYGGSTCTVVGSGTSTCFDTNPSVNNSPVTASSTNSMDFVQWNYPTGTPGVLAGGGSITLSFDVTISPLSTLGCVLDPLGNFLLNSAHVSFNAPGSTTTIQDTNPANNTATVPVPVTINAPVDPSCAKPILKVEKTQDTPQPPGGFAWGSTISYTVKLTNLSATQTIGNIQLFDSNGVLGDIVQAGMGTPPFTAQLVSWTCASTICTNSQPAAGTSQQLTGYGDSKWMFGTSVYAPPTIGSLGPQTSVTFQLQIKYSNPACDSYPDVALKPVHNFVRAAYQDLGLGHVMAQSFPITALMKGTEPCQFTVRKSADLSKITFGVPTTYSVTFANPTTQAVTVGTLIDTLRIAQSSYASQLPVAYSYTCAPTPSGVVTGYPATGTGSVNVVYTTLAQQGVRIIQNTGPVTFQPQSSLTCTVTVTASRPPAGDASCARLGELENIAIVDTSAFYNSNLPWPPGSNPGFAAKVTLPLPQCLDLVVNKRVYPIWTTQNGGPLAYTLTVTNFGDPIVAADGVTLTDAFTPGLPATSWNSTCNPATPACVFTWNPGPTSNPSTLNIGALGHSQSIVTTFPVPGPYPPPPGTVCNHVGAAVIGLAAGDWYAKDPATWQADLCAPVFDTRSLVITKTVTVTPPATAPPVTTFTADVVCSFVVNGIQYGPSTTVAFNYPPNPGPRTFPNIPIGGTCTVTEQPPPTTPIKMKHCPSGFGSWGEVTYPTSQNVSIVPDVTLNKLEVHNSFACVPLGSLSVTKTFDPSSPATQFPGTSVFPVQVACSGRPVTIVNLTAPGFQQTVPDIAMGTVCTITELAPSGTSVQPNCHWETTYPKGQSVAIPNGSANLEARNKLLCTGTLRVEKIFEPSSLQAQMPPGAVFPVQIACSPGVTTTVSLSDSNQFQFATPAMPTGTLCAITELAPQNTGFLTNCQWTTTYPKGQSVTIPNGTSHLQVQNRVACSEAATGSLTVKKTLKVHGDWSSWPQSATMAFQANVACVSPAGVSASQSVTLNTANLNQQVVSGIQAGSLCTITETPPVNIFWAPCHWVVTYPMGQQATMQPGSQSLEIYNYQSCTSVPPGKAQFEVRKRVDIIGRAASLPATIFQFIVTCPSLNGGAPQTLPITVAGTLPSGYQNNASTYIGTGIVLAVTPGDTCTVAEPSLPPLPSNLSDCAWAPGYPTYTWNTESAQGPGTSITAALAEHPYRVGVNNKLVCPPAPMPPPPGSVTQTRTCPAGTVLRGKDCVRPIVCTAPMVPSVDGLGCACPPGTTQRGRECVRPIACTAPMIARADGRGCACPPGTAQRGRECIKPTACIPPMIAGPIAGQCVCRPGTVQKGRECVQAIVCRPPMIANRAGTECNCAPPMLQRGRECVMPGRPDARDPRGKPRDDPRGDIRERPSDQRGGSRDPRGDDRIRPANSSGGR